MELGVYRVCHFMTLREVCMEGTHITKEQYLEISLFFEVLKLLSCLPKDIEFKFHLHHVTF